MTIDVSSVWNALCNVFGQIIRLVSTTSIKLGGVEVSILTLAVAALVVDILITWFIPWNGDSDD